jgi:hypothetical protein
VPQSALPPAPLQLELAFAPALSYRLQPEVEPGIGVHARLTTAWPVSFELGFSYWLPSEIELAPAPPGSAVDFNATVTTLSACLSVVRAGPIAAFACAGAGVAVRWLETTALAGPSDVMRAFVGPSATAELRYAFSARWFALASASVLALFPRDSFFYTNELARVQPLFEPSTVGFWAALGAGALL